MADVVVTVPKDRWATWLAEGDLPGQAAEYESHFMLGGPLPAIQRGERVWIVAYGRVRGFAPLVRVERSCSLDPSRGCLLRAGGAEARTVACQRWHGVAGSDFVCERSYRECRAQLAPHPAAIRGFQGWRRPWWQPGQEIAFPSWMIDGVPLVGAAVDTRQGALL